MGSGVRKVVKSPSDFSPLLPMDESTSSSSRVSASGVVSASAVQILLDSLIVAQPFQSGGSQSDDLLLAFEQVRRQLGEERSTPDYVLGVISKRVDNPKRLKNKCELISAHRYVI